MKINPGHARRLNFLHFGRLPGDVDFRCISCRPKRPPKNLFWVPNQELEPPDLINADLFSNRPDQHKNPYLKLYPVHDYGNPQVLREIIEISDNIIRLTPPLTITKKEVHEALSIIKETLDEYSD